MLAFRFIAGTGRMFLLALLGFALVLFAGIIFPA